MSAVVATPEELREIARMWDESARSCRVWSIEDEAMGRSGWGMAELAERDRRIANAMRRAADILESRQK